MQIQFTKRYNKNLCRYVYYAKSNSINCTTTLLNALLKHNNFTEWKMQQYNSLTHKTAIRCINTNTNAMLSTTHTWQF